MCSYYYMKNRLETMMKIHKTQNLNSLSTTNQSTSVSQKKNDGLNHTSYARFKSNKTKLDKSSVSFKGMTIQNVKNKLDCIVK